MKTNPVILTFGLLLIAFIAFSHGGKKHGKDTVKRDSVVIADSTAHGQHHHDHNKKPQEVTADLDDFPSIHPLIVHFAIVLIIVAALLQLINIAVLKREFVWIITGLIFIGFNAAALASTKFHPHTHGLSEQAKQVLALHDKYADWTLYLTGLAGALQIFNLFVFKQNRGAVITIAMAMVAASYCVIHAGHYGAQLVHVEGVGPQGKFLETDHHH